MKGFSTFSSASGFILSSPIIRLVFSGSEMLGGGIVCHYLESHCKKAANDKSQL